VNDSRSPSAFQKRTKCVSVRVESARST
jgi:hypothetical protein